MVGSVQVVFCQKNSDDGRGGHGSSLVEGMGVLDAAGDGASGGEVAGQGAACGGLARVAVTGVS